MKLKILTVVLILFSLKSIGQDASKIFDKVKEVTIRNFGAIKKNNVIKGYYFFYEYDRIDRETVLFRLNLMDENLNDLGTKDIEGPSGWQLISSGYDGNNFCFKFLNGKDKTYELHVYDQQAKEVATNSVDINYKAGNAKYQSYSQMVSRELNVVDTNGFVDYTFNEPNDAFITSYANGSNKKTWQTTYEPDGKSKMMLPNFLGGNNQLILTAVSRVEKGLYNAKTENSILANSISNGTQLFDVSTEFDDNHVVPINAVFHGDTITVIGLNYKSAKTYTSAPDGFAFIELDKKGKVLKTNFKTFEETIGKYLPMENHKLAGGYYLYIHNIVQTDHNTNLIIAEKFKKAADAGGIAVSALFMAVGGSSSAGFVKLALENLIVLEYDQDGTLVQAKEIPKAKGSTGSGDFPSYTGFLPPYLLALTANNLGLMDYMYTLTNDDKSEITFSFRDYDRLDESAKKTQNFGQIKYKDGKLNVDKVPIENKKADFSHLLPAKPGYVLQINYYKKDKKLSMDFIKLNN